MISLRALESLKGVIHFTVFSVQTHLITGAQVNIKDPNVWIHLLINRIYASGSHCHLSQSGLNAYMSKIILFTELW